jgi:hypothetical protein
LFPFLFLPQGLADNGTLAFANDTSTTFEYTYNALEDTSNVYSIQLFTNSDEYNFEDDVLTVDFKKFVDFYGTFRNLVLW